MRKSRGESNLRFAWQIFVALVTTGAMIATIIALFFHSPKKIHINPGQRPLQEGSQEGSQDEEIFDMSKIIKKYLISNI